MLTNKMAKWTPSITALGLWDSEVAHHCPFIVARTSSNTGILPAVEMAPLINCSGRQINLQDGTVDGRAVLSGVVETDDGMRGASIDYPNPSGFFLQFNG